MNRRSRALVVAGLLIGSLGSFGACGGGDDVETKVGEPVTEDRTTTTAASEGSAPTTSTPAGLIEIVVVGGEPQGGIRREAVAAGSTVTIRVTADVDDEVHVHGYDLEFAVGGGRPAEVTFDATIPGVFEVELHDAKREILRLQVGG